MHLSPRTRGDCAGELLDLLEDEMACGLQACGRQEGPALWATPLSHLPFDRNFHFCSKKLTELQINLPQAFSLSLPRPPLPPWPTARGWLRLGRMAVPRPQTVGSCCHLVVMARLTQDVALLHPVRCKLHFDVFLLRTHMKNDRFLYYLTAND